MAERGGSKPGAGPGLGREIVGAGMKRECGGGRFSKWGLALCNTEGAVVGPVHPAWHQYVIIEGGVGGEGGEAGMRRRCSRAVRGLQRVEGRVFGSNVRRPSCSNYSKSPPLNDVINSMT